MNKNDILVKLILNKLSNIIDSLHAYKKVDATLFDDTLIEVLSYLNEADLALEKGFVEDACKEIEQFLAN